jgi:hypothetical protein
MRVRARRKLFDVTESANESSNSFRQLLVIAAFVVATYACARTLRFTFAPLNFIIDCAWLALPLLAIRPTLRLRRPLRVWGIVVLAPLLSLSSLLLVGKIVFDGLLGGSARTEPLQALQQGSSTIELQRYEHGGAVGVHGLNLEQRRLIVPGVYLVRSVDFFSDAREGTLSVDGPYTVRVHAKGNYFSNDHEVERVHSLKPWVYF